MNAPPLIRPLRSLLQGRLPLAATTRPVQGAALYQLRQIRNNASVTNGDQPPASNADGSKASTKETESSDRAAAEERLTKTASTTATTAGTARQEEATTPEATTGFQLRYPRNLQALYLKPLRREAKHGLPTCDLQLRSYSVRNLEFFCDFALRAAYYLGLPAFGPVPLPRLTERWTVPKSSFIFKKSQENFERITLRRLIQIRDGHPETVQVWLAFLKKHAYHGVGMKANVWEYSKRGVGKTMDENAEEVSKLLEDKWAHLGQSKGSEKLPAEQIEELLVTERIKAAGGR
ncbi:hypothetical protein VTK73DRAFT_678 [Phialemonium thermophilum]|uniref:Small ribosomal subunit protein uS10 domain-containing protein n=1 Tax=Phialemonium thermophilum TaxID=223376 RepID=A0ABR3XDE1_9PEZI